MRPPNADEAEPGAQAEPQSGESRSALIERLFREHNASLLKFLRLRVGSHHEALEVAQEAYVRLLSLDRPGAVSYLRAFLFTTAANIAVDRRRRHHVDERAGHRALFMELYETRTPERQLAGEQTLKLLDKLVSAMPAKCREAFVLSQIEGLDAHAIAQRLNISVSMVRKYIVRALLHCREHMDIALETGVSWHD